MKNKTDAMNGGYTSEEMECGYGKLPDSEVATWRDRKNRQEKWAGTYGNEAMNFCEGTENVAQEKEGGFLARANYKDRF